MNFEPYVPSHNNDTTLCWPVFFLTADRWVRTHLCVAVCITRKDETLYISSFIKNYFRSSEEPLTILNCEGM